MPEGPALPACVLLAHGSPDPDWREPIEAMCTRMRELDPAREVVAAYLASCSPTLPEAIRDLTAAGHRSIHVLAAFLSPGGRHIKLDIPALVDEVRVSHPGVEISLVGGAIGAEPEVIESLARAALRRVLMG